MFIYKQRNVLFFTCTCKESYAVKIEEIYYPLINYIFPFTVLNLICIEKDKTLSKNICIY